MFEEMDVDHSGDINTGPEPASRSLTTVFLDPPWLTHTHTHTLTQAHPLGTLLEDAVFSARFCERDGCGAGTDLGTSLINSCIAPAPV